MCLEVNWKGVGAVVVMCATHLVVVGLGPLGFLWSGNFVPL